MVLVDTHAFLWFVNADKRLSNEARSALSNGGTNRYLSVASLWEIAIKVSLGKLTIGMSIEELKTQHIDANGIQLLPVRIDALDVYTQLPLHHRDPFDRLIVAQAMAEGLSVITKDSRFSAYALSILW